MAWVLLGVIILGLVAAGVLVGVFAGKNMTKGIYKEAWVTFHMKGSDEVIKERIIVDDQEVYIRKPGEVGVIYDYGKNTVTMQLENTNATEECGCMVFDFDPSTTASLQEIVDYLNMTYIVDQNNGVNKERRLISNGREVDVSQLSKRGQEMCLGCRIYEMVPGAFLIPYCLMLCLVGLPLFYMELSLGQFASLGPITIWKFNPILKGVGYASVIVNWLIALYYNVIVAQCIFYFFASMTSELPWISCNNTWNTPNCAFNNETRALAKAANLTITTPTEEYYRNYVLQQSTTIADFGVPSVQLTICLLGAWFIVWLVLLKGIQTLGKVVYFTAIFPYLMLTILLIRGVTLDGAIDGIRFYLEPKFEKLADPRVWSDAATQIFYSLSCCTGGMVAMSSYNKFNNNCYRDSIIVSCMNCGTSIFAGFVIFSILGFIANEKGVSVEDVATDGPGLAFEVYPEALAQMPVGPLWSVLFFLMMLTLGFGSEFSMVECLLSAFADEFPKYLTPNRVRSFIYRTLVIISCFLLGIPMVCNGGLWLLNLVDYSVSGFPLLLVGLLECVALNWIYDFDRFAEDIEMMLGKKPNIFWRICWKFATPFIIIVVIFMNIIFYKPAELDGVRYPDFANALSWLIAVFPMSVMVLWALYEYCHVSGGFELLKVKMRPTPEWGPANSMDRKRHQRYQGDFLPLICMDPAFLAKLMGSNISNISNMTEADVAKKLGGLTPVQSQAVLEILASASRPGTPSLTPAASLLALARSNGSVSQLSMNNLNKRRTHTTSECSGVSDV